MFFIVFKLIKSIFDSAQSCVDSVDIQPHAWHTFLYILNPHPPFSNLCYDRRIIGDFGLRMIACNMFLWQWMSSCSYSCSLSGLPSCRTPLTSNIFISSWFFSRRSYSTLTWLMTIPSSSCHITTWGVWLNSHTEEAYHCHDIVSCVAWYNEAS